MIITTQFSFYIRISFTEKKKNKFPSGNRVNLHGTLCSWGINQHEQYGQKSKKKKKKKPLISIYQRILFTKSSFTGKEDKFTFLRFLSCHYHFCTRKGLGLNYRNKFLVLFRLSFSRNFICYCHYQCVASRARITQTSK